MATTPRPPARSVTLTLVRERDTKRYVLYGTDPQGYVMKDVLYVSHDALLTVFQGTLPDRLNLTISEP